MPEPDAPPAGSTMHATGIDVRGACALIIGPSGAGKSDLALRCLTQAFTDGAHLVEVRLVGDDRMVLERHGEALWASAPDQIAGLIEVRDVGIVAMAPVARSRVRLVVDISGEQPRERLPAAAQTHSMLGLAIPVIRLAAHEASAPAKVIVALLAALRG